MLDEGDVVHFSIGPSGAHQLINCSDEPVRYLMAANRPSPDAVEYPDSRQLSVMAFTDSQLGGRLWDIRTLGVERRYAGWSARATARVRRALATPIVASEASPATVNARAVPPRLASQPAKSPPTGARPRKAKR